MHPAVYACLGLALHGLAASSSRASPLDDVAGAVSGGESGFAFRYRYEHVDQDAFDEHANASTLRARYTWTSAAIGSWGAGLEADYVSAFAGERYHSTTNGKSGYPVVADPEGFDLNQAYLTYTRETGTLTGGRQRIGHGGERFVGGVGWRQNEQTFDAIRVELTPRPWLRAEYAYLANVNRVFGPDGGVQPADWRSDSHLLTADVEVSPNLTVTGFGYLMDFENDDGPASSNATFGAEARLTLGPVGLTTALARQSDYAANPVAYTAWYVLAEATMTVDPLSFSAGWERLGSDDGGAGFRTPLATLHRFQGWADQFLNTPNAGVRDAYLGLQGTRGAFRLSAVYHRFKADEGGEAYGSEVDVALACTVTPRLDLELKYADYRADGFASDARKAWLTVNLAL